MNCMDFICLKSDTCGHAGWLVSHLSGVFITKGDLGVGTIVGSAVFNILVIIGICGIFAGQVPPPLRHTHTHTRSN